MMINPTKSSCLIVMYSSIRNSDVVLPLLVHFLRHKVVQMGCCFIFNATAPKIIAVGGQFTVRIALQVICPFRATTNYAFNA